MRKPIKRRVDQDNQEIDLTPMLDVVFIMLIFFIVTASFIKEPGLDVLRPEALTANKITNQSILIAIGPTNEVWIDKTKVELRAVPTIIERMHNENPKGAVVIQADDESNAESYAIIADAAKKAGVVDIHLATSEK
jgi:biopolymer transport protein ExbD